MTTEEADIQSR